MKALVWNGDGFLLLYKRLDDGRYRWPKTECEAKQLTSQQLRWLMTVNPAGGSKLAMAVQYALNEKRNLYGFLADPGIEISNNRAENAIRPFVVGRKNSLFSDSPRGASASAMLYSLVVSTKMNGLNAEEYLIRLFRSDDPVLPY